MSGPTSIQQQWDPRSVLNIYPAQGPLTCSGKARQGTRRCGWELPSETEIQIETVLVEIGGMQPNEVLRHGLLRSLAVLALCEGRRNERFNGHRGQLNQLMQEWSALVTEAYPRTQPLSSVRPSQSPVYTSVSQQQQISTQQSTVPTVSKLSSHRLSGQSATPLSLSSESMSKQDKSSIQICVTETYPATFKVPQTQADTAFSSNHRQYSEGSSMALGTISSTSYGRYEEFYPQHRGFLRRVLGCFCC